jgi:signal transduction histidine kinase
MIAYFALMVPSLYVDHVKKRNFNAIKEIQENYLKDGDYDDITSPNPVGAATIKIPAVGNEVYFSNKFCSIKITISDKEILKLIEKVRYYSTHREELENIEKEDFGFNNILDIFKDKLFKDNMPVTFELVQNDNKFIYEELSSKFDVVSEDTIIYQADVYDGNNYYTNYMAMSLDNNDIIASVLTVMTPGIQEIRPIIFQSLPMIIAVTFLLILIATIIFSRKIVIPIEKLANQAVFIKENTNLEIEPMKIEGQDEIAVLGLTLNDLYAKLNENFKELEEKNKYLSEQNKRQEVFLRASSHQLKTPVAAGLLLVDGMINEIGKYKNTKEYLPKVKVQLQEMRKIIDDILNLKNSIESINKENIDICEIIDEVLLSQEVQIKSKEIHIQEQCISLIINTDRKIMFKIIDNLINNAINYTPKGERIVVALSEKCLTITNYGVLIEEELLPHIFEPFVSSNSENRGHGLGLYIVAYYAKQLNCEVKIRNVDNGVEGNLYFTSNNLYKYN